MALPLLSLETKCRILDHLDSLSSIALVWKDVLHPLRQRRFRSVKLVTDSHIRRLLYIILSEPRIAKLIHQLEVAEYGYGSGGTYECTPLPYLLARLPRISILKLNKLCTDTHCVLLPSLLAVLPPSKLTKVSLDFVEWTEVYRILFILHSFPHVEDLRISGFAKSARPVEFGGHGHGVDLVELYNAPAFESVKRLELSGYQTCCHDLLRVLAYSAAFPNLESLTLGSATVSGGWMKRLAECCARWSKTLHELRLPSIWIAYIEAPMEPLVLPESLETLEIHLAINPDVDVDIAALRYWSSVLERRSQSLPLKHLSLRLEIDWQAITSPCDNSSELNDLLSQLAAIAASKQLGVQDLELVVSLIMGENEKKSMQAFSWCGNNLFPQLMKRCKGQRRTTKMDKSRRAVVIQNTLDKPKKLNRYIVHFHI